MVHVQSSNGKSTKNVKEKRRPVPILQSRSASFVYVKADKTKKGNCSEK
jgi:hypothetical protein